MRLGQLARRDDAVRIRRDAESIFASPRVASYSLEHDGQRISLGDPSGTRPGEMWCIGGPDKPMPGAEDAWLYRADGKWLAQSRFYIGPPAPSGVRGELLVYLN